MIDNDMTSDMLIYNILKQSEDEFIGKCNLKFIDRSVPNSEDDVIYIANVDLETLQETFDTTEYKALVNLYIKTKTTDYVKGSRFLRTTAKRIKMELRNNDSCKERRITFRNMTYEYGSSYTLKGLHMLIQLLEVESKTDDPNYSCVNIPETNIEVK